MILAPTGGRNTPAAFFVSFAAKATQPMLAPLVFFVRLPAAGFAILHPVKVVSLRDLHPAESLRFPLVAGGPAASALRPPL